MAKAFPRLARARIVGDSETDFESRAARTAVGSILDCALGTVSRAD
jgi:hypothetical protein